MRIGGIAVREIRACEITKKFNSRSVVCDSGIYFIIKTPEINLFPVTTNPTPPAFAQFSALIILIKVDSLENRSR